MSVCDNTSVAGRLMRHGPHMPGIGPAEREGGPVGDTAG